MFKGLALIAMVGLSIFQRVSTEDIRLQYDYYNALQQYYGALDDVDWVTYYGNGSHSLKRTPYRPVFVSPTMQWAVPNNCLSNPPAMPPASNSH